MAQESPQRLKNGSWYFLTQHFPTPRCRYLKGSLRVAIEYGRQLYFIYKMIKIN